MSMENAILEHAAALREVAAAIAKAFNGGSLQMLTGGETITGTLETTTDPVQDKAAELAEATGKRTKAAKDAQAKDAKDNAELEQAVSKVEDDATLTRAISKEEIKKAIADAKAEDQPELGYVKDIRPTLLAAIKKAGKEKVQAMIATFGVAKADLVPAEKFPALLAAAKKLAA